MEIIVKITNFSPALVSNKTNNPATQSSDTIKQNTFQSNSDFDWRDTRNSLFSNLLKDKSVQEFIKIETDGTYSIIEQGKPDTFQQNIVRRLVSAQNGSYQSTESSKTLFYTEEYLIKFKNITGYILITAAGGEQIVDDMGNPPNQSDRDRVNTAWDVFGLAAGHRGAGTPNHDLSSDDLISAAQGMIKPDRSNFNSINTIIDMIQSSKDKI